MIGANGIRINFLSLLIGGGLITIAFLTLAITWVDNTRQTAEYQDKIKKLEIEKLGLGDVYSSTRQFVRIMEAARFCSANELSTKELVDISEELWIISRKYSFDPLLILALVTVESQGDPDAMGKYRSGKLSGALGLMQIKMGTAKSLSPSLGVFLNTNSDLMNPRFNIMFGATYLIKMIFQYKSLRYGIMAYNIGPGTLNKVLRTNASHKLPMRYYNRLLSNYRGLVGRFGEHEVTGF